MVEGALVFPLFFLLVISVFEFGLVFRSYLVASSAVSAAARTASTLGNSGTADAEILQKLADSMRAEGTKGIESISIYRAGSRNQTTGSGPLAACRESSVIGLCNTYSVADLSRPAADFGCLVGSPDRFWCPTDRKVALSDPPDFVGIHVRLHHDMATGLIGSAKTFDFDVVYRMEPKGR